MLPSVGRPHTARGPVSSLPPPLAAVYGRLPLALRDRLRVLKRPLWSWYGAALWRASGGRTCSGPFQGMRLGKTYYPATLLGTYEREIHPWLERIFTQSFTHIVDIGGGTGYYAVGLALRMPRSRIIVFELSARARDVIADVARQNGVMDRIDLRGECTLANLALAISPSEPPFLLVDVEGAELVLLDPRAVPALRGATLLVETHDVLVPGCRATISSRFAATHDIEEVTTTERTLADVPPNLAPGWRRLFPALAREAIHEPRSGPQVFMLLTPRTADDVAHTPAGRAAP